VYKVLYVNGLRLSSHSTKRRCDDDVMWWNSSVVGCIIFQSHSSGGRQRVCVAADVFSGCVATRLEWGWKLSVCSEATSIRPMFAKITKTSSSCFRLQKKNLAYISETHGRSSSESLSLWMFLQGHSRSSKRRHHHHHHHHHQRVVFKDRSVPLSWPRRMEASQ